MSASNVTVAIQKKAGNATIAIQKVKRLTPWKKSNDKSRQRIKKERQYLAYKSPSRVFPVVTHSCESWTIKKTDTEELMPSNCGAGGDS